MSTNEPKWVGLFSDESPPTNESDQEIKEQVIACLKAYFGEELWLRYLPQFQSLEPLSEELAELCAQAYLIISIDFPGQQFYVEFKEEDRYYQRGAEFDQDGKFLRGRELDESDPNRLLQQGCL